MQQTKDCAGWINVKNAISLVCLATAFVFIKNKCARTTKANIRHGFCGKSQQKPLFFTVFYLLQHNCYYVVNAVMMGFAGRLALYN